jgi:predicted RNase H-like nuclease (RuvC/YqgF family)
MTPELENEIRLLKNNLHKVKELHSNSVVEINALKQEINKLSLELEQKDKENKEIENKFESLKLAKIIATSSTDSHDAKIKLNRIVREIDKCISLLNK